MGGRLDSRDCFFAVKKNVDEIKREEFDVPKKDDEYSTSVLGIQFTRDNNCTVQIISRYNHTVGNPNCTLGNDLNKLAPGLEQSFANLLAKRGLTLNNLNKEEFEIPKYTIGNDGKYYKYNMEINGDYYCPGNIIVSYGNVKIISNPEEGLLIDYFFLDKKNKKITVIGDIEDSFVDDLQDIEKIEVVKSKEENVDRVIKIHKKNTDIPVIIGIDRDNQIVKYENKNITNIGARFLVYNERLTRLELPNLLQAGERFLFWNEGLTNLKLPNLKQVGNCFLYKNTVLTQLELSNLEQIGDDFLGYNEGLTHLKLPSLKQIGSYFLYYNEGMTHLELPNLTQIEHEFLYNNESLTQLELPKLAQVGNYFLYNNQGLTQLELPNLEQAGDFFLYFNEGLTQLELPNLTQAGYCFLGLNEGLTQLNLPSLTQVKSNFLNNNISLTQLELPNLTETEDNFLYGNKRLTQIDLPNLAHVGKRFLYKNKGLTRLELPNLTQAGKDFLCNNEVLTHLKLPKLPKLRKSFSSMISKNKKTITSKNIAQLDRDNELTTSEMNLAHRIIQKLKGLFKKDHMR